MTAAESLLRDVDAAVAMLRALAASLQAAVAMQCAGERQEPGVYRIEPNGLGEDGRE